MDNPPRDHVEARRAGSRPPHHELRPIEARSKYIIQIGLPAPFSLSTFELLPFELLCFTLPSRLPADLDGLPVSFLSKELLIRNKTAAHRPKDLGDLSTL